MPTQREQLKDNVEAKRKALEARLAELKASTVQGIADERDELKKKLEELSEAISDGWNNLSEAAAKRLNDWLSKH